MKKVKLGKSTIINSLKNHCENLPGSGLELELVKLETTGSHEAVNLQIEPLQTENGPTTIITH